ncbi:MAG: zinc-dependent metalloprotease, partial [Saprospiraceae bacterium]|nr:zinc-dependent metalloprotease [Saprospiraceae bacterium]
TPPHRRSNGNCNTSGTNVCDGGFFNELYVHNFMDYSSQECQFEFTPGQVDRMKATIEALRRGWKYSPGNLPVAAAQTASVGCVPQTKYPNNSFGLGIIDFQIGDFLEHSGNTKEDGGYVDHTCGVIQVQKGQSYDLSINTGNQNKQNVKVFVDYNGDGDFSDAGETVFSSNSAELHLGQMTIPTTAKQGVPLRVRAIAAYSGFGISSPCFEPYYGQAEDYALMIGVPSTASSDLAAADQIGENIDPSAFIVDQDQSYQIYPNPASDIVYIQNTDHRIRKIEVLDVSGKLIGTVNSSLGKKTTIPIDVRELSAGIHYLRITDDVKVTVKKLNRI